jgi:hypothetical protein
MAALCEDARDRVGEVLTWEPERSYYSAKPARRSAEIPEFEQILAQIRKTAH